MKLLRATLLIALLCIIVEYPSSLSASSNDDDQLEEGLSVLENAIANKSFAIV